MHPRQAQQPEVAVLMSGGIDSAAVAHLFISNGHAVRGIFVDYGQAASDQEWLSARALATTLSILLSKIEFRGTSNFGAGELIGRNAFLVSAAAFLGDIRRGLIAIGVHAGTPYYDCSASFIERMKIIVEEQSSGALTLTAPFVNWSKSQTLAYFIDAGLPLAKTYSCESGTIPPCGSCASCRDREALDAS